MLRKPYFSHHGQCARLANVHARTHAHTHTRTHAHARACVHTRTQTHTHTHTLAHAPLCQHVLVVTRAFESQADALHAQDLGATMQVCSGLG